MVNILLPVQRIRVQSDWGNEIPHAVWHGQKLNKIKFKSDKHSEKNKIPKEKSLSNYHSHLMKSVAVFRSLYA